MCASNMTFGIVWISLLECTLKHNHLIHCTACWMLLNIELCFYVYIWDRYIKYIYCLSA